MTPEEKLAELGITLPPASAAVANYVPFVQSGNMLFISGVNDMLHRKRADTSLFHSSQRMITVIYFHTGKTTK